MVYTLHFFSSSKCRMFHDSNVFGSCIIHILYIYSTNIGTEYFKHGIYPPVFYPSSKCSLFHNSNIFGSCIIHILYTGVLKLKKNSGANRLKVEFKLPSRRKGVFFTRIKNIFFSILDQCTNYSDLKVKQSC